MMAKVLDPLLFTLALCGAIFIVIGLITKRYPPKKINHLYGYRTNNSMRSQERWDFAQIHSAWEMVRVGLYMCILSIPAYFIALPIWLSLGLAVFILIVFCVWLFLNTEKAIDKKFGKGPMS